MNEHYHLMRSLFWLIMFVGFVSALLIVVPQMVDAPATELKSNTTESPTGSIPPPSEEVLSQLAQSRGFQALISYTDHGFEPAQLTLSKGEAVRFTNNSQAPVWIGEVTGTNTTENPNTLNCGETDFNSCKRLKSGEFWEYSFYTAGEFVYMNNASPEHTGVVVVVE